MILAVEKWAARQAVVARFPDPNSASLAGQLTVIRICGPAYPTQRRPTPERQASRRFPRHQALLIEFF